MVEQEKSTDDTFGEAKSVFGQIANSLKGLLPEIDLNTLVSVANPMIGNSAEATAKKVKEGLPENHWLRGAKGESVIGILSAMIGKTARRYPDPTMGILLKASYWLETFARALREKYSEKTDDKSPDGSATAFAKLSNTFFEEGRIRMRNAKTPDEKIAVASELQMEAEALVRIKAILNESPREKPDQKPKEPPTNTKNESSWTERFSAKWKVFTAWVSTGKKKSDEILTAQKLRNAPKAEAVGKVLESPLAFLWKLVFGFGKPKLEKPPATPVTTTKKQELQKGVIIDI